MKSNSKITDNSKKVRISTFFNIVISFAVMGVALYFFTSAIISDSMYNLEEDLIVDHLNSDINYIKDLISDYAEKKSGNENLNWFLSNDGKLYYGGVYIAGGSDVPFKGDANPELTRIFVDHMNKTGTFSFLLINDKNSIQENKGHYIRALGTTKDSHGKSIVGTYVSKEVSDKIDSDGVFSGIADVQGTNMYCIYRPIYDSSNEVLGIIVVGRNMSAFYKGIEEAQIRSRILIFACILLSSVFLILWMKMGIGSLDKIKNYIKVIGTGEFPEKMLELKKHDKLKPVADCVNDMVVSLKENERIGAELSLATDIQANMLPRIFPPFPEYNEFDIFASMQPAKEVGGDFYDFFMVDDSNVAVVIADVSGKGVPAALFMVIAKTLIKDHAQLGLEPAEVFTRVNKILCDGNEAGLFVTAWMGVFNCKTGVMRYVNAGHNPPLVYRNGICYDYLKARPGFVLAGMDTIKYKQAEIQLTPGDKLYLYTDGVTEATNKEKQLFGEDRLCILLNEHKQSSITDTVTAVKDDIVKFVDGAEQFDDITMLIFEYKRENKIKTVEKTFEAVVENLDKATEFIDSEMDKKDISPKIQMQINVAFEELFVNVAHYAYPNRKGDVITGIDCGEDYIKFVLKDSGIPFNPLNKENPDITLSAEKRDVGGLGIYMVKKTMDNVEYEYKYGMNIVSVTKKI